MGLFGREIGIDGRAAGMDGRAAAKFGWPPDGTIPAPEAGRGAGRGAAWLIDGMPPPPAGRWAGRPPPAWGTNARLVPVNSKPATKPAINNRARMDRSPQGLWV